MFSNDPEKRQSVCFGQGKAWKKSSKLEYKLTRELYKLNGKFHHDVYDNKLPLQWHAAIGHFTKKQTVQ